MHTHQQGEPADTDSPRAAGSDILARQAQPLTLSTRGPAGLEHTAHAVSDSSPVFPGSFAWTLPPGAVCL